jgi:hypothetical protein
MSLNDPNVWSGRALQENFDELAVSGLASMYPAFDWRHAPGHHGYQRACDLISRKVSTGPLGSPVFACAGKIVLPSRLISRRPRQEVLSFSRRNGWPYLESSTTSQHSPGDACELVGERDGEHVAVQPLLGRLDPALEPMTLPALRFDQHHPGGLHEQNAQIAVTALRYLAEYGAVAGRDLLRYETQPGGEVATFRERVASTDRGHK